ncbi:putative lipoprotein [Spiroplasma kunkelii CR2-3x]|uniref:Putative lipoprotein n=1 Tax=Spiroplasma kunkelii CR2-3x TaxID=273035 RepID=A0A0K2JGB3_SPIKU|nr:lipoprotein [Spiroplasma kunkelii]ALA97261.1 putative lipoprotein [Spiroplasma kunkelii CR2-3x]
MKRLLSLLGSLVIAGSGTSGLISCKNPYIESECERNDKGNWHQLCLIDFPFKDIDNNYYITIWRTSNNDDWKISMFKYETEDIIIDQKDNFNLEINSDISNTPQLLINKISNNKKYLIKEWLKDFNNDFFKWLYVWKENSIPNIPNIDKDGNIV